MSITDFKLDWTKGCVFLQDGTIYCSPNCSRPVLIPPKFPSSADSSSKITACGPFDSVPITSAVSMQAQLPPLTSDQLVTINDLDKLTLDRYKQPVWWDDSYGWLSFVPLTPSFTAKPFESLCWMPRIHKDSVYRCQRHALPNQSSYGISFDDQKLWKDAEDQLVEAAEKIRLWYHLPGRMPPWPSSFGYMIKHSSLAIARQRITQSRDWFVVWMGYVSYLVAQSQCSSNWHDMRPDPNVPVPPWYTRLASECNFRESWLDGLTSSTVCQFDSRTPRAGIIYEWTASDKTRPHLQFFLDRHIPVYFPWRCVEENALKSYIGNLNRQALKPPEYLVKQALDKVFTKPDIPLAAAIIRSYYKDIERIEDLALKILQVQYASSYVYQYVCAMLSDQRKSSRLLEYYNNPSAVHNDLEQIVKEHTLKIEQEARIAASLPTQTMLELDKDDEKGKLYDDCHSYFTKRLKRRVELLRVEEKASRDIRLQRERQKPLKNTTMYAWKVIRSSGGVPLYMRVRIRKSEHESGYHACSKANRVYDGFTNEWDLCHGFTPPRELSEAANDPYNIDHGHEGLSKDESDDLYFRFQNSASYEQESHSDDEMDHPEQDYSTDEHTHDGLARSRPALAPTLHSSFRSFENHTQPHPAFENSKHQEDYCSFIEDERDNLENIRVCKSQDLIQTLKLSYGYVPCLSSETGIPPNNWISIAQTFGYNREGAQEHVATNDQEALGRFFNAFLGPLTEELPADLWDLNNNSHASLAHIHDFRLIHRPQKDLYVFSEPREVDTDWMIGVQSPELVLYICRLIHLNSQHTIVTLAHHLLLRGMPFRTLIGMFVGNRATIVAKPYTPLSFRRAGYKFTPEDYETYTLQCRDLLELPHGRAALLKGGIIARIARDYLSLDDCLQGLSYKIKGHQLGFMIPGGNGFHYCDDELTEDELATICGTYTIYTGKGDQVTIKSWFPPANLWDHTATHNGVKWVEWSERNENFYIERVTEILDGTGQPMTRTQWKAKLQGSTTTRKLMDIAERRAQAFVDQYIPVALL